MYSYGLSVFSIALIFLTVYLQLRVNKSELRQCCILMLTCSLITNISLMFQILNIKNEILMNSFEAFALIGITMMPICWFLAVCYYIDPQFQFTKKHTFLFVIPILSVIATFTNPLHHLMFQYFSTSFMARRYGIMFYIMLCNSCIVCAVVITIILRHLAKDLKKYKNQLILSLLFILLPMIIALLGNLKILSLKSYFNGIAYSLIAIITIEVLLKYQILTMIPISLLNVLNTITDGFIVVNKKGKIIAYNTIFVELFNLGRLDIQKVNIKELVEFKEFDTLNEEDIDAMMQIQDMKDKIVFERTSEKLKLTLKYEESLLEKRANKLFLIAIIDITGYSKDIQSLELNKDALVSKEKLASLGQMIGGIAHNLKTPIFSIAGALEGLEELTKEYQESITDPTVTIEDHQEIAKDMYDWTEKIQGYLSYMTDIITAIQMQTSTTQGKTNETFTLKELVKYIHILMKYELKQNLIDFQMNLQMAEETKMVGNINILIQVLNNLITNAIQAYSKEEKNKKIVLDIFEKQSEIYLTVTDFAGGIPEEVKNKLFKEMVTTKGKNGSGLGLFISYTSIKTGFGGNLCFTTNEGIGTTFQVIIPKTVIV